MKRMKLIASVILVIVLALALTVTAFATPAGSIKIANPKADTDYDAYKIFDATANSAGQVSYTLDATSAWAADLINTDGSSKFPGLTFTPDADPATEYTVTKVAGFNSANFAEFLKGKLTGKTADETVARGNDPMKMEGVADGYYLIVPSAGDKAALTTVLGNAVTVQDKNDMPFDKEIVDGTEEKKEDSVQIGDTVNYKITGKVPTLADDITFSSYIVHDTMDPGLTFDPSSFAVTINGTNVALTTVTDPGQELVGDQVRFGANGYTFELSLEMLNRGKDTTLQGKDIEITYSATVNPNAVSQISENHAHLEYSDDNETYTKDSSTKVYPVVLIIDKFETGAPEQKLSGAEFVLYKVIEDTPASGTPGDPGYTPAVTHNEYYRYNVTTKEVTWIAEADLTDSTKPGDDAVETVDNSSATNAITKVITDTDGAATFGGLEDGTYYLKEIKAPAGYTLLDEDPSVTINASGATDPTLNPTEVAQLLTSFVHVSNTPESILPSTGGSGTTMLFAAGLVLILAAGAFLVLRKRGEVK
jgi:fimbrial isopeptide formation D2 family protein/LPXTG-motif cell wall-anchored protein